MEEKTTYREISFKDLWAVFTARWWIMLLAAVICVGAMIGFTALTFTPQYSSTASMYILRHSSDTPSSSDASTNFALAINVVNDCDFLLKSDTVLKQVSDKLNLNADLDDMKRCISTNNPTDTRILQVTVVAATPELAKQVVDALIEVGAKSINDAMGHAQVNLYEYGSYDTSPCNVPAVTLYLLGAVIAAILVYLIFFTIFYLDDTLKTDEDCRKYLGVSIIGDIPDLENINKKKYGGHYRGYYRYYGYGYQASQSEPDQAEAKKGPAGKKKEGRK